jgi:hypothetical protein
MKYLSESIQMKLQMRALVYSDSDSFYSESSRQLSSHVFIQLKYKLPLTLIIQLNNNLHWRIENELCK